MTATAMAMTATAMEGTMATSMAPAAMVGTAVTVMEGAMAMDGMTATQW